MALSLRRFVLAGAVVGCVATTGCDKVREIVHEGTRPDEASADPAASTATATPTTSASASATPTPSASASASASPTPTPTPTAKRSATKPAPREPLNGLPAGAVCVQGASGNGGCASGSECANGKCTCYNGWTSCGGACRDLSRDPYNCDQCGRQCNYGQYCRWGRCE